MNRLKKLAQHGLYSPQFEHDSCGVGVVANIKGGKSHQIINDGLEVLVNLGHRGAVGADPETGDGAGILMQIPHGFLHHTCEGLGIHLPEPGQYGVGMVFLPMDRDQRHACERQNGERRQHLDQREPGLGTPAPASDTRTASDAATLEEVTSDLNPDPDLYAISVADALQSGLPLVVSFSTPAFCSSATCGPQLSVVKQLKDSYSDKANFIHVEIYANPKEMQGDPESAEISPIVDEWGLPTEPYTFVIDVQGRVAAKFEAFVSYPELEEALVPLLE